MEDIRALKELQEICYDGMMRFRDERDSVREEAAAANKLVKELATSAKLAFELVEALVPVAGDGGNSEGAAECLKRII